MASPSEPSENEAAAASQHGLSLLQAGRTSEAVNALEMAARLSPNNSNIHYSLGYALLTLQASTRAAAAYRRATELRPDFVEAYIGLALALIAIGDLAGAKHSADMALRLVPRWPVALNVRSEILREQGAFSASLRDSELSLATDPSQLMALNNQGIVLMGLGDFSAAKLSFDRALDINPDFASAISNRSSALRSMGRFEEAIADADHALELAPGLSGLASERFYLKSVICDWNALASEQTDLRERASRGEALAPWHTLVAFDDPELQLKIAQKHATTFRLAPTSRAIAVRKDKLRVAYFSPDFRDHPTGHQIAPLLEAHDKQRFEVYCVCLQSVRDDPVRLRVKAACASFIEAERLSDAEIANLIATLEIDIAVDLAGYAGRGRTKALAEQNTAVTVNYFGYPGTLGTKGINYIIADKFIIPAGSERFYEEAVVRLPGCYYPAGTDMPPTQRPSRAELSLPDAFVFCCFNSTYKVTPDIFDIWMTVLKQRERSVLWLYADHPTARSNLQSSAERRGVSADRLVFADRVDHQRHLNRLQAADLFLDTLPCNAHTTASDALWAGVPVLSCAGDSFASRAAGSMLTALGLEELVVDDAAKYEAAALKLSSSLDDLSRVRAKMASGRASSSLFNIEHLCRHIEEAFRRMIEVRENGQNAVTFDVP